MKKFLILKRCYLIVLSICLLAYSQTMHAQVFKYVAVNSGNWSSPSTWEDTIPTNNVTAANIKINIGVTVTLDQDVVVNGVDSSISRLFLINGNIDGPGRTLKMQNMRVEGGLGQLTKPLIKVDTMFFGVGTFYSYNGLTQCKSLINRGGKVVVDRGKVWIADNLILLHGLIVVRDTANFRIRETCEVHVKGGRILNLSGNPLINVLKKIRFVQRMDSLKALAPRIEYCEIDLPDDNDSIILANDLEIDSLDLKKGNLMLRDKRLVILGKYIPGNGRLAGSPQASLRIEGTGDPVMLKFAANKQQLKKLSLKREVVLNDSLTISDTLEIEQGGILELKKGLLLVKGKLITAKGKIRGSKQAIMEFTKGEMLDTLVFEVNKDTLREIRIEDPNCKLPLGSNLIVNERLINKGTIILSAHKLVINKEYSAPKGLIAGHKEATIELMGNGEMDTLRFEPLKERIKALTIDRVSEKPIIIGSKLEVDSEIDLKNGKVKITKGEIVLGRLAKITHANAMNYIIVAKRTKLIRKMNGNNIPVLFPVGNDISYTPCELTQISGKDTNEYKLTLSDTVYADGNSGTAIAHKKIVKKTWYIETDAATIEVKIKIVWKADLEDGDFNKKKCYISHYMNGKWDTIAATEAKVDGDNFYLERDNLTSLSPFTVMSEAKTSTVNNVEKDAQFSVFPVPAGNFIAISTDKIGGELSIINSTGKVIHFETINNQETVINLDNMPEGLYFIRYNEQIRKFIKN